MNDQPLPDDDAETGELDLPTLTRVRAAIREVPEQDPARVEEARRAALEHLVPARRTRQPAWLIVAAAGVVGVLSMAVLNRTGGGRPSEPVPAAQVAAELEQTLADTRIAAAPMAASPPEAAAPPEVDDVLDELVAWVQTNQPVAAALCPLAGSEQSYGERPWSDVMVEVLVDRQRGTLRVVDVVSCATIATATITP